MNQAEGPQLFYSSDRANKLSREQQNYLDQQANAQSSLAQALAQFDAAYQQAKDQAQAQYIAAAQAAAQRAYQSGSGASSSTPPAVTHTTPAQPPASTAPSVPTAPSPPPPQHSSGAGSFIGGLNLPTPLAIRKRSTSLQRAIANRL